MWVRSSSLAIGGLAVSIALAACSGSADEAEQSEQPADQAATQAAGDGPSGTLVAAWDAAPENWAPGTDNIDGFMRVPYETLIQRSAESGTEFEPMLATEWEVTDEKVTLVLRDDVTFHDGTEFNAEAVKANLEYVQAEGGPFSGYLDSIETINVVDTYTVELVLSEPDPAIEIGLASRAGLMGSPAALEDGSIQEAPVGTGPWRYDAEESTPGTRWIFDYFPDYYDPSQAKVERIELVGMSDPAARYAAIQSGEIDITEHDAAQVEQAEAAGYDTGSVPGTHIAVLMVDRGPGGKLEDVETRRAVCSGVDMEAFGSVGGEGARTVMSQRYPEGEYGYNPEIAGWTLDPDLASRASGLSIDIGVFEGPAEDAEAIAGELAQHGINLDVEVVPAAQYFTDWYTGWDVGIGDNTELHPYHWYKTWFAADGPNNAAGTESDELKAAADAAIAAGNSPEAEALWQDVMMVIHEEALACMHFDFNFVAVWDPERVSNVVMFPYMIGTVDYRQIEVSE